MKDKHFLFLALNELRRELDASYLPVPLPFHLYWKMKTNKEVNVVFHF